MAHATLHALVAAALVLPFGGSAHRKAEEGNRHYDDGAFDDALRAYTEAQVHEPESPALYYDIGNVLYRQGDFEGAAEAYTRALLSAPDRLNAAVAHNLGNARYEMKAYQEAVDAYERALRADPGDASAKRNLELALRALAQQPPNDEPEPSPSGEPGAGGAEDKKSGGENDDQQQEDDASAGEGPEPAPDAAEAGDRGELSAEQAERLLDGVAEQELENLRQQALQQKPAASKSPEVDW